MTPEISPAGFDPQALSRANEMQILAAAAADPRAPGKNLRVLHEEAFRSESPEAPMCFMVIGEDGMIGVAAPVNPDGTLGTLVSTPL